MFGHCVLCRRYSALAFGIMPGANFKTTVAASFNWPMLMVRRFSLMYLHCLAITKPVIQELFSHKMVGSMLHFIFTEMNRARAVHVPISC